ncbi:zyxin/trip6 [Anaeramoeba flamelloides]|uniref:Zyxin/trip6 n=1 Tax=Anaeramoeba flamelloides TaxID=1746091 RepID=A0AAV7Z8E6_9EUKA|nr:zyxin/trip6 [Anaeramoeba flamelloides]KAJ6244532.1 zyxin/trip6 [Anaeramoeba flamelloides]|eukprot:Anaeramoba_flamelloidesa336708_63.p1 GENE.a336708_63~~a336708_63.p1  ORF type:complete len:213 (-),score=31.41 a336708_63:146-784(-)
MTYKPPCEICKLNIVGKIFSFNDKPYHGDCFTKWFVCDICKKSLARGKYIFSPKGQKFHFACFKCNDCKKIINSQYGFFELEHGVLCPRCNKKREEENSEMCKTCNKPIRGESVQALGSVFHPDCFVCKKCNKSMEGGFVEEGGFPYHPQCYESQFGEKCGGCGKEINTDSVSALGKIWHEECFKCVECNKIIEGSFFESKGMPLCEVCAKK